MNEIEMWSRRDINAFIANCCARLFRGSVPTKIATQIIDLAQTLERRALSRHLCEAGLLDALWSPLISCEVNRMHAQQWLHRPVGAGAL